MARRRRRSRREDLIVASDLQAEKERLVLECTCDRLSWKVRRLRAEVRAQSSLSAETIFWIRQVNKIAGPWLPRWWRAGCAVLSRFDR